MLSSRANGLHIGAKAISNGLARALDTLMYNTLYKAAQECVGYFS